MTDYKWFLALPDCSPIVLLKSIFVNEFYLFICAFRFL